MRERSRAFHEQDPEGWRKYHREAQKKSRAKKRDRIKRDEQLKELGDMWEKELERINEPSEDADGYGERQKQKTLERVPRIDVSLAKEKKQ